MCYLCVRNINNLTAVTAFYAKQITLLYKVRLLNIPYISVPKEILKDAIALLFRNRVKLKAEMSVKIGWINYH
jgi:hypothetical protein